MFLQETLLQTEYSEAGKHRLITEFAWFMAQGACCPVACEIPGSVRKGLEEYMLRKRKADA